MMSGTERRKRPQMRSYLSLNLIAFGIFWAAFSGLCTVGFALTMGLLIPQIAIPSLLIGAIAFGVGWWMK